MFLVLRLRSVLRRRRGHEDSPKYDPFRKRGAEEAGEDKVIALPGRGAKEEIEGAGKAAESGGTPLEQGLTQIKLADRSFESESLVRGAKVAFEIVVDASRPGREGRLRDCGRRFRQGRHQNPAAALEQRRLRGLLRRDQNPSDNDETLESTLVGISEAEIIEAELHGKTAFITVKFVSEQINVTHNAEGEVVDGGSGEVTTVTDIWTFARYTRSRDPNWTLVATGTSN